MDSADFPEEVLERKVSIIGSELVENYTVYIIEVTDGDHKWTIKHRYSDFHDLHEKLTAEKKVDKHLLPPKKMLGKNSKSLVEKRQKELEVYLQTLLLQFPTATPKVLSSFLHFNLYEINGITAALAEELFHKGEQLLVAGEVFSLHPLQLYSVSQQLRLAKPTCSNGDAKADLGHILDFTCRLRYLKIPGTRGQVGTSNIQEDNLPFDLSVFKSLIHIEISECNTQQILGLPSLRSSLATLSIHNSAHSMMSVLVPEACEFPQWESEGVDSSCPVTTIIPVWRSLTTLDMSHNHLTGIDHSVKLIPKVEFLDLSHNQLSSVENLQHLYNLVHLDLSYNALTVLEGVHTRLGNIKTLNLAGNQLDSLTGLSKLYSLVNLDLSHNQLAQLEEIRNIGALPCLEKLNLSNNPLSIIPDYRTKVLTRFWDRAAEVCLDGTATTEKELDTVEVLKAIQKAKEAKDRMANSEKKISEETRLSASGAPHSSSSSPRSSFAVAPPASSSSSSSSPPSQAQQAASSSQEVERREEELVAPPIMTPVDVPQQCFNNNNLHNASSEDNIQVPPPAACPSCHISSHQHKQPDPSNNRCTCSEDRPRESEEGYSASSPVLPSHLLSLSSSNKDFISQLSRRLSSALREQEEEKKREERSEEDRKGSKPMEVKCNEEGTDLGSPWPSSGSRDGYFEMGLDDSLEEGLGSGSSSSSTPLPAPPPLEETSQVPSKEEAQQEVPEEEEEEEVSVCVLRVVWCHCVRVETVVEQRAACLVLTDRLLGLLLLPTDHLWSQNTDKQQIPSVEEVLASLQTDLLIPYSELLLSQCDLPDSCLALGVRSGPARWYLFSEHQDLSQTQTELAAHLARLKVSSEPHNGPEPTQNQTPQQFLRLLLSSWEVEESQGARGGYPAHLLLASSSTTSSPRLPNQPPDSHPVLADLLSQKVSSDAGGEPVSVPCLLFLTQRHLCVLKVDFTALAARDRSNTDSSSSSSSSSPSSWSKLIRVPLGSVAVHPRQRTSQGGERSTAMPCPDPGHHHRQSHVLQLVLAQSRLLVVFPVAQDRLSFLGELTQRRASLEGVKTLYLPTTRPCQHQGQPRETVHCCCCCNKHTKANHRTAPSRNSLPQPSISLVLPSDSLVQRLGEENQPSPHLSFSLSPGLALLSGLGGEQLLAYFQHYIAQSEGEELSQVLWMSVVLYKSPEAELTSCLLLSTNTIYFLLEDSASSLSHHTVWDVCETGSRDPEVIPCYCLTIRLSDLLSVNVGLFDQYFRVVGRSADQIVCCLSRDSYGTHRFLQQLMSVLSLQEKLPSPEPSEQDFYSQFGNKSTGKMQNYELVHSSRVKFVYPSEEEMGDLTFIVAERKTPVTAAASTRSFNILLYLLVFQVQLPTSPGPAPSQSGSSPVLQPRTLILTSTDVFLLEEDYISYPLPDFAKEPPSRDKYQLREARRIRDLDRVLMGYQTYPQALTMVFDDLPGPDLLCHLTMDHFTAGEEAGRGGGGAGGAEGEVQWCIFVPGAESRERLICLLARQWEALCSRELPVELTG